jgi:hypothetical protein
MKKSWSYKQKSTDTGFYNYQQSFFQMTFISSSRFKVLYWSSVWSWKPHFIPFYSAALPAVISLNFVIYSIIIEQFVFHLNTLNIPLHFMAYFGFKWEFPSSSLQDTLHMIIHSFLLAVKSLWMTTMATMCPYGALFCFPDVGMCNFLDAQIFSSNL